MRPRLLYSALISIATLATGATASAMAAAPGAFAFKAALASGQLKALSDYSGAPFSLPRRDTHTFCCAVLPPLSRPQLCWS